MGEGDCRMKVCHRKDWSFEKILETFIVQTCVPKMSVTGGARQMALLLHTCVLYSLQRAFSLASRS